MTAKLAFRPKIYGIDLDGVCFDFLNAFRLWLNDHLHCHLAEEEITSYYWYETTDISKEEFMREFDAFGHNGGYLDLNLLPGTKEALMAIAAAGNKIWYITHRPTYALVDTMVCLNKHNFPFRDQLIFTRGKKSSVIQEKSIDVFIDDSPRIITEITANTKATVYCRSYLFNKHLDDTFFTRVNSWEEFLEYEGIGAE